jgi:acyl dehydratase
MAIITKNTQEGQEFSGKLKTVTEERVYAFSGGFPKGTDWPKKNIHTDLEFAKSCGLPTRAASGAMFEGYLTELMIDLFGENWLTYGKMSLKFIAIVDVNDTILPKATVQSKQVQNFDVIFTMDLWCENQHGNKVVVGMGTGIV